MKEDDQCSTSKLYTANHSITSDYYSEVTTPSETKKFFKIPQYRKYKRIIKKSGASNIKKKSLNSSTTKKLSLHLQDLFTSLVELRWRWILLIVSLFQVISWFLFAFLWWIIAFSHGDLSYLETKNHYNDPMPCVIGVEDFITSFLFSLETQFTTGYGTRVPSAVCPDAIFLLVVQNIFGAITSCVTLGLIFTKASRSKARQASILFSHNAVIRMRDGKLRLLIRVADVRKSKIINVTTKGLFISPHKTLEGEFLPLFQRKLELSIDDVDSSDVCFLWPVTLCHTIDGKSPLYEMSAIDMLQCQFEIIVCLTGTLETTGQLMEAKTSYLPNEILWGHQFQSLLVRLSTDHNYEYAIDYNKFQETKNIDTPVCSAYQLTQLSNPNSPTCFYTTEPTYSTIYE